MYNSRNIHHTRIALYGTRGIAWALYLFICVYHTLYIADNSLYFVHTSIIVGFIYTDCTYGTSFGISESRALIQYVNVSRGRASRLIWNEFERQRLLDD